jgi:uncharacterized protein (TIGR00369 family)
MNHQRRQTQEQKYAASPNHSILGLSLRVVDDGEVTVHYNGCPEGSNILGNPAGGLLAQMVDSSVIQSALTHLVEGDRITTLEMKVNYLRSAPAGEQLVARGSLEHIGRTTAVGIGRVEDSTGRVVAMGTVTASIRRAG